MKLRYYIIIPCRCHCYICYLCFGEDLCVGEDIVMSVKKIKTPYALRTICISKVKKYININNQIKDQLI